MVKSKVAIALFIFLVAGCQKAHLNPAEFSQWMKGNMDLTISKDMGDYKYQLSLIPADWIAYTAMNAAKDAAELNLRQADAEGMLYYRLTIDVKNGKTSLLQNKLQNEEDYYTRLYYVSYKFKDNIHMKCGDKTYTCKLYNYERTYDLNSKMSFTLGFERPEEVDDDVQIEIRPQFFSDERVKFLFNRQTIQAVPKLVI